MAKKKKSSKAKRASPAKTSSGKQNTGWGIVGTIPILGFILVVLLERKNSFAMYYGKQGLVLGLAILVLNFVFTALLVTFPLVFAVQIVGLILWIMSIVNAASGKMKPTPWLGKLAEKIKF